MCMITVFTARTTLRTGLGYNTMEYKYICHSDTYYTKQDSIAMAVSFSNLPEEIVVEDTHYFVKSEFHITLVPVGKIIEKNHITIENFKEKVIADFCEFVALNPVNLLGYSTNYRLATDKALSSIVVMCVVSNLDGFYTVLNEKYGLNLETHPTYITVYDSHRNIDVMIADFDDIQQKSRNITVPELMGKF